MMMARNNHVSNYCTCTTKRKHKALAGIVKKGTKAIKAWIEPTDWMRGLHRHMVPGRGGASCLMPILQGKHGSHIYVAGVTCTSLTSRIPKIP